MSHPQQRRHVTYLYFDKLTRWFPWVGALLFAAVLTSMPLMNFKDRDNYLNYFADSPILLLMNIAKGPLALLTNEPLFLLLCTGLNLLVGPYMGLRIIIFSGAFLVSLQTLKVAPKSFLLLFAFLLAPQVLENHIVHLRQGLAIGVFLFGWRSTRRWIRWTLMLISPLVHASFFFVLMFAGIAKASKKVRFGKKQVILIYLTIGLALGVGLGLITNVLQARQGEEQTFGAAAAGSSGLGFAFWILPLTVMLWESRHFFREHILEIGTLLFYLATYFISPFSARVFESTLLLILLSSFQMSRSNRNLFTVLIVAYSIMQWLTIAYGLNPVFSPES